MGFLNKLWDETLAGPAPESGLGKLRKYNSFSAVRSPNHPLANAAASRSYHQRHGNNRNVGDEHAPAMPVSRSITILRPKTLVVDPGTGTGSESPNSGSGSGLSSPALSTAPSSPFTRKPGSPNEEEAVKKAFTRRKKMMDEMEHAESSPTAY